MATQYMTESRYPQIPSGFSIVVDDVDGDQETEEQVAAALGAADLVEQAQEAQEELEAMACECGSSHERRSSREPLDPQLCSERIRQIQVEAQSRKNEFAKLLEEHAQVVLRVKQMEQREHQWDQQRDQQREQQQLQHQEQLSQPQWMQQREQQQLQHQEQLSQPQRMQQREQQQLQQREQQQRQHQEQLSQPQRTQQRESSESFSRPEEPDRASKMLEESEPFPKFDCTF